MRHAWDRLIRKQWLIFYPLALAVVDLLAFLAVYVAVGGTVHWSDFLRANFDRWQYVRDHLLATFSITPQLAIAVFAGVVACVLTAMIRAPLFRAIAGPSYPLAPRRWKEAGTLALFYLFSSLIVWVLPLAAPAGTIFEQLAALIALVVAILLVFADYVIVFEGLAFLPALRRSVQLLTRRLTAVLAIFIILQLIFFGLHRLYALYYEGADGVFILLPLSQILVESFIVLFADLALIFLYEQIRRHSPA